MCSGSGSDREPLPGITLIWYPGRGTHMWTRSLRTPDVLWLWLWSYRAWSVEDPRRPVYKRLYSVECRPVKTMCVRVVGQKAGPYLLSPYLIIQRFHPHVGSSTLWLGSLRTQDVLWLWLWSMKCRPVKKIINVCVQGVGQKAGPYPV